MRVSVIGCGYLGAVHAAGLAKLGHDVIGIDLDDRKIALLERGQAPFFEPGFAELLSESVGAGRLRFSTDMRDVAGCEVHFLCVGTPQRADGREADLTAVYAATRSLAQAIGGAGPCVVAGKSTVPVGTAAQVARQLAATSPDAVLVWNPEFLREGLAVADTLHPDRIVYGLEAGARGVFGAQALDRLYADALAAGTPKIETDFATAELVKVSANSFLALKISFINAVAGVCEVTGADVRDLAAAIGLDDRIGPKFLRAGIGFGGGCLPKDLRAFGARAAELGADGLAGLLGEVDAINLAQRDRLADRVVELVGPDLTGVPVAILGAAFKPGTDDLRDSPALAIAQRLAARGARVRVYDPAAGRVLAERFPQFEVAVNPAEAAAGAGAVLVLTEWPEFANLDPGQLRDTVAERLIVDGRNALDPARWRQAGWEYHGVGVR
jgi:UDPglucose 6-dehydrogenase